jgi:murein L,D-transpeptidase YafK
LKLPAPLGLRALRYAAATLLLAAVCACALVMNGRSGQAVSAPAALPAAFRAPSLNGQHARNGPEAMLSRTLQEVGNRRLDAAASEIDKIIRDYPNFRLAHLIKGDLLLARARPLTTVGDAAGAPLDRLEDLRAEARARSARLQQERPVGLVPGSVVQLQPQSRHLLVVDTARSTLYLFENRGGELSYVTDYYVSIGRNGIDKVREGDNKTPLGVYHVTGRLSREKLNATYGKLAELYGVGALPINYPNEWDRREGRNGHGIWLHGTPSDTYSRPPRASDGCIVLANADLEAVGRVLQVGLTPVIIADEVEWIEAADVENERQGLAAAVAEWRADWESRDTERYLGHYSPRFRSGEHDLGSWAQYKRRVNAGKTWIKVGLSRLAMFQYPRESFVVVSFEQDYRSNNLSNAMHKRQYWMKENGRWKIVYEGGA